MAGQQIAIGDPTDSRFVAGVTSAGALKVDGSAAGGGTTTANQGAAGTTANAWPVKVTDGTDTALVSTAGALVVDGSAVTQPVSGTVTANAGTGPFPVSDNAGSLTVDAPLATPVGVRLSDGAAALTTSGGRLGVTTGSDTAGTSLNAVTADGDGTVIDFSSARTNISFVVSTTGAPTAGTVTLAVSVDNTSFFATSTTATVGSGITSGTLSNGAWRYARLNLSALTGGTTPTVTAKLMAS